jgi:GNAT superfamily N-acetyltransferase
MSRQDLAGNAICIHSVCVDPEYQGKGVAKAIMTEYIRRAKESGQQERILLICHENLVDFYKRVGLKWRAKSESNHGGYSQWQEMGLELK